MKKVLKWIGWIAAGVVGLLIVALLGIYVASSLRLNKIYQVQPEAITLPTGDAAVAEGSNREVAATITETVVAAFRILYVDGIVRELRVEA